jgi:MFS family permease
LVGEPLRCRVVSPGEGRAGHGVVPHTTGFWLVAAAFVSLQAFGTVPTPLWPLYAVRDGLSPTTVTLAFACMVVGAGASLYFFGHLSDRVGRRRIIVPALAFGIAAAAVMAWWPTLPGLLIGRVLTGVAVGLMASTATTYLTELYRAGHPAQPRSSVPATVASVANLGGLSSGRWWPAFCCAGSDTLSPPPTSCSSR